ncbi:hypothetical protein BV25DRAFT_291739 [Artomyces pyxidatus]|uniref:Uncharacterized protein n=1 Tax=Artomyces pyxidatus TaxID=48021 RepID=A0ACB8SF44_9AGAM|nr:hypothetical protein BV25DRAFT_291739 [Artomyces pyxidatus]
MLHPRMQNAPGRIIHLGRGLQRWTGRSQRTMSVGPHSPRAARCIPASAPPSPRRRHSYAARADSRWALQCATRWAAVFRAAYAYLPFAVAAPRHAHSARLARGGAGGAARARAGTRSTSAQTAWSR